jgi:hypothetical protein
MEDNQSSSQSNTQSSNLATIKSKLSESNSRAATNFLQICVAAKVEAYHPNDRLDQFGPHELYAPRLGRQFSPFADPFSATDPLPSVEKLKEILLQELDAYTETNIQQAKDKDPNIAMIYFPPQETAALDRAAATELINRITDPTPDVAYNSEGAIVHLPSPTLEAMSKDRKRLVKLTDAMYEVSMSCTVLPRGHVLQLQHHNEAFIFSTLMTGALAWLIWPPNTHNLGVLEHAYDAFAVSFDGEKMDVAAELQGGVMVMQKKGEALRCPPLCPVMAIAIDSVVMARYSIVTTSSLMSMCETAIPLYRAWWKTEMYSEAKQKAFATALLDCMTQILNGDFDYLIDVKNVRYPVTQEGPLRSLITSWDGMKENVLGIMDEETSAKLQRAWITLMNGTQTMKCIICGAQCRREKKRNRQVHFEKMHWLEALWENKGVDDMEVD